jgi:hypothetical protein
MVTSIITIISLLTGGLSALDLPETESGEIQQPGSNEVFIFTQTNYQGSHLAWELKPGLRQRLVLQISDQWAANIKSIQIGTNVGVMLYQEKYFKFSGSEYVNLTASTPDINQSIPGRQNRYASLIVYPKIAGGPSGILAGNGSKNEFRFFYMPENASEKSFGFADVRHLMAPIDFVMLFSAAGSGEKIRATLFSGISYGGNSLVLPIAGKGDRYSLADYGFAGVVQSIRLEVTSTTLQMQPYTAVDTIRQAQPKIDPGAIAKAQVTGICTVHAQAIGSKANLSSLYAVTIFGPGTFDHPRESKHFDRTGRASFQSLPEGRYLLKVTPDPGKVDSPYRLHPPNPPEIFITCTSGNVLQINFTFGR